MLMHAFRAVVRCALRPQIMGRDSHDVDFALDTHTGVRFATLVNEFLASSGQHVSKVGTIAANPEQSKHLETATMKILGRFVDFVNLRSEKYAEDSRIPVMVRDHAAFSVHPCCGCMSVYFASCLRLER